MEVKIKNWLIDMANVGMPVTKKLLLKGASILAHKMNLDQKDQHFRFKRLRYFQNTEHLFLNKILKSGSKKTEYMDKNDLSSVFEDPNRIWNLDESSFDFCPSIKNAIGQKTNDCIISLQIVIKKVSQL